MTAAATPATASPAAAAPPAHAAGLRRDALRERLALLALATPAVLLVTLTMALPVAWLFGLSFVGNDGSFTLAHYERLLAQPSYARIFAATFKVSFITTGLCILLAYPLAYVLAQVPRKVAAVLLVAVMLPFWTSILVRTYAWLVLLQRQGLVNQWGMALGLWDEPLALVHNLAGTLVGMVHIMLPFMVLPLLGSMRAIDPDVVKAAANLGASPTRAFWSVYFPLSVPGLLAGSLIVFIICLGFYVTPAVLGGGKVILVSNQIANDIELFFNWGPASALGVVLLVLTLGCLAIASRFTHLGRAFGEGRA